MAVALRLLVCSTTDWLVQFQALAKNIVMFLGIALYPHSVSLHSGLFTAFHVDTPDEDWCNKSNTRDSVSSGYLNTEKKKSWKYDA